MSVTMSLLELYSRAGVSLESLGINEAVLIKKDALCALTLFAQSKTLILGGDIYRKDISDEFFSIYADWYYNGDSYLESVNKSKEHISKFDDDLYVSFIFKD